MLNIPIVVENSVNDAAGALNFAAPPPLSLYIHFPWCLKKCPYCDFNSHEAKGDIPEERYVAALISDLEQALPLVWGRPLVSLFFGGGTPSLLSAEAVDQLLAAIRARLPWQPHAEITLEANPGAVDNAKLAGFRAAGVNRLSIGIQSFKDSHLQLLGRAHNQGEARDAAQLAHQHFETFNLDLMYGLPTQTLDEALTDLRAAIALAPTHLSCYQLSLEPNTRFAAHPPANLPDADLCADMQDAIEAQLASAGFVHYETSAFAKPGHECRHNLNYWHFGDYLGIGAGAHSKITLHDRVIRQSRWKHPNIYLDQVAAGRPVQDEHPIKVDELAFEFLMNALRLNQGFDPALFAQRTALPLALILPKLRAAQAKDLLRLAVNRVAPTETGRRFLNVLLRGFLPDQSGKSV